MFEKSTRFKLAIIPILACVLGFLIIKKPNHASKSMESIEIKPTVLVGMTKETNWPEFQLEEIAFLKPFQTLKQLDEIRAAEGITAQSNPEDPELNGKGRLGEMTQVRAIFQTPQGASALIGNQVFRVGDALPDGSRIVAIRSDGVEVADE